MGKRPPNTKVVFRRLNIPRVSPSSSRTTFDRVSPNLNIPSEQQLLNKEHNENITIQISRFIIVAVLSRSGGTKPCLSFMSERADVHLLIYHLAGGVSRVCNEKH